MTAPSDKDYRNSPTVSTGDMSTAARPLDEQKLSLTFKIGEIISGRYRVIDFIAQGGMGEVYEAEDQELGERLALKTVRPKIASDTRSMERFRREVQLARKVTHRNVCRIFDVDHHQRGDEDIVFLTMELLNGQSLSQVLRSKGRMTTAQALPIVQEMIAALAAAHRAGIVHRDFKSSNVMLVQDKKELRTVVTDFGLARTSENSDAASLSGTGEIVGTPAYMAPEQIRGEEITPAVDIYALGVVLYEMVTERLPFEGGTPVAIAIKRLEERPSSPRTHVANLDRRWEATILRCLEKNPAHRFRSAEEVLQALETTRKRSNIFLTVATLVIVLLFAFFLWHSVVKNSSAIFGSSGRSGAPEQKAAAPATPTMKMAIAVLPFADISAKKDQEYISDGLTEELTDMLARNPRLRVISRTSAFSFKGKQVDMKTISEKLNVTHVLEGSVRKERDRLRITTQLIDVRTDSHVWSQTYDRSMENIFALQDDIAGSVEAALKVTLEGGQAPKAQETKPEAYTAYLQGRYFSGRRNPEDAERAIRYFEQALRIDPNYARAWNGLAFAHMFQVDSGFVPITENYPKAQKEVRKALELDPNLADAYIGVGWMKRSYEWDWSGADMAYKRAIELEPGNAEALNRAAFLAIDLGRFDEAISLQRRAIELNPVEAAYYWNLGKHLWYAGRWKEGEAAIRKTFELNRHHPLAHALLGRLYIAQSRTEQALVEMQKEPDPFAHSQGLALAYSALEKKKEADVALAELIERFQNVASFEIAEVYAYRGEIDKAFEWLGRAYKQRDASMARMKADPLLRNLHTDPRWRAFLKKMKLPLD